MPVWPWIATLARNKKKIDADDSSFSLLGILQSDSYRYWQRDTVYPDAKLIGRVAVVVVSQILQKLSQVHLSFALVLPKNAKLLHKGADI